jgi:BASS family bile acid:Na+ symporter
MGHLQEAGLLHNFLCVNGHRVSGLSMLKGFSYTVTIFMAVTTALYYPTYFIEYNGFKFAKLITPLLQIIMFGMGTSMSFGILPAW